MSWISRFVKDIRSIDKSALSLTTGFRAAAFAIAPIIVGFAIHQPALLLATLGAIFLTNTERAFYTIPSRILLAACLIESASFGLGTLVATSHLLSTIFLGIGIFVALIARVSTKWAPVGTFAAIIFAVGAGLPGYSVQSAGVRTLFSLIGMLWALLGIEIHRFALSHRIQQKQQSQSESTVSELQPPPTQPRLVALRSALMIGIASAIGYTIGLVLGLPRDFWAVLTIIVAIRPSPSLTISLTCMMVFGTIIGAMIAAVITLENSNPYLRLILLFSFSVMLYATMRVNVVLTQILTICSLVLSASYPASARNLLILMRGRLSNTILINHETVLFSP
jgi:hypothetical protein